MRTYIYTLLLSQLFDTATTIANVFKYHDPYLKHELNFMLKGKYWPWLFVHGLAKFVIFYVLFSIAWRHRVCLIPKAKTTTFWEWCNSCLYGHIPQPSKMTLPKWKNALVFLVLIVLLPFPLLHMVWGLHNTLVFIGYDVSFVHQYEQIFVFLVCTPFSVIVMYLSLGLGKKPNESGTLGPLN
jgi:hypothetical protein